MHPTDCLDFGIVAVKFVILLLDREQYVKGRLEWFWCVWILDCLFSFQVYSSNLAQEGAYQLHLQSMYFF